MDKERTVFQLFAVFLAFLVGQYIVLGESRNPLVFV